MKRTKLTDSSRFVGTPLIQLVDRTGRLTNSYAFTTWNRIDVRPSYGDVIHRISEHEIGRLDTIAYNYYGDPMLWWVIADRNNMMFPVDEMVIGKELIIPSIQAIRSAMAKASQA